MSFFRFPSVKIVGCSAAVPKRRVRNCDVESINNEAPEKFVKLTGVEERRLSKTLTASDLCYYAALKIMQDAAWESSDIDIVVFVSEFRDYSLPSTSCILQQRLKLRNDTYCVDLTLGCSGWVYGLNYVCSLLSSGTMKKALLLTGESKESDLVPASPLFGHAGAATALEYDKDAKGFVFNLGTDGSKFDSIIIPGGACRNPMRSDSFSNDCPIERKIGLQMNGINVFAFSVKSVPPSIINLAEYYNFDYRDIDIFVLHQANKIINDSIINILRIPKSICPTSINKFGNTSSASIPLTIVLNKDNIDKRVNTKFLCSGFGVGMSWGSTYFAAKNLILSDLIEVDEIN